MISKVLKLGTRINMEDKETHFTLKDQLVI